MEKLNIVRQFIAFEEKSKGKLKSSAIAVYLALLHLANRASYEGGVNPIVAVDNARLIMYSGIGSKRTLYEQRKNLVRLGFIKYKRGRYTDGKSSLGQYELVRLYEKN